MVFPWSDAILLILLASGFVFGYRRGLLEALGEFVGLAVGIWMAQNYASWLIPWIARFIQNKPQLIFWIATLVVFVLAYRVAGWLFHFANILVGWVLRIPLVRQFQSLIAALLGFLLSAVLIGGAMVVGNQFVVSRPWVQWLANGRIAEWTNHAWQFVSGYLL